MQLFLRWQQQQQQKLSSCDKSNEIWQQLELFLQKLNETEITNLSSQKFLIVSSFQSIFQQKTSHSGNIHVSRLLSHLFYPQLKQQFVHKRIVAFRNELNELVFQWKGNEEGEEKIEYFQIFLSLLNKLYDSISVYLSIIENIQQMKIETEGNETDLKQDFITAVYSNLFSVHMSHIYLGQFQQKRPEDNSLAICFRLLLTKAFDAFCLYLRYQDLAIEQEEEEKLDYKAILDQFSLICKKLNEIGVSSNYFVNFNICTSECLHFVYDTIQKKLEEFVGQFEEESLSMIMTWLDIVILPFLNIIFPNESEVAILQKIKLKTRLFIYTSLAHIRINELFDIIKCFPDSKAALMNLKECLIQTDLHKEMITSLKEAISKRLIIPGAKTIQIISQFINIIKGVSIIDPTGVSLKYVSEDIKNYLADKRSDTIKCIVKELTDEDSQSDLFQELLSSDPQNNLDYDSDDIDEWTPAPIYPNPSSASKGTKPYPDIIKIFVNIFRGNKELFANEYRNILSDRLLSKGSYDTNDEARILEMLKIRFGEKTLQMCEIMIKDMSDSKFINSSIHQKIKPGDSNSSLMANHPNIQIDNSYDFLDVIIISRLFWPPQLNDGVNTSNDSESNAKLHPVLLQIVEKYERQFISLKAPRKLLWRNEMGLISLEVEIGSKKVDIEANPIAASVLLHFCDRDTWTITQLSKQLNLDYEQTERKIMYWVIRGFLRKGSSEEEFILVEELDDKHMLQMAEQELDEEMHHGDENELKVYESIIINMLTNMEVMPLDKIHNMLGLFVHDPYPPYDKTMQELGSYLNELVQEGTLEFDNGMFRIRKQAI
jgi:anaphase-promoting complex subunit 2